MALEWRLEGVEHCQVDKRGGERTFQRRQGPGSLAGRCEGAGVLFGWMLLEHEVEGREGEGLGQAPREGRH